MQKVILFDFDGTIADSVPGIYEIFNILAEKYNFTQIQEKDMDELRGEPVTALFKRYKVPLFKMPLLARDTKTLQMERMPFLKPIAGIKAALDVLQKEGYVLGILTSDGKENVESFLQRYKLEIFQYITSDSSLFGKDKVLHRFMKKYAIAKENLVYVGDEIRDVEACKKISVPVIAVTWGFNSKEGLQQYRPNYLIQKPGELVSVLSKHFKNHDK